MLASLELLVTLWSWVTRGGRGGRGEDGPVTRLPGYPVELCCCLLSQLSELVST